MIDYNNYDYSCQIYYTNEWEEDCNLIVLSYWNEFDWLVLLMGDLKDKLGAVAGDFKWNNLEEPDGGDENPVGEKEAPNFLG